MATITLEAKTTKETLWSRLLVLTDRLKNGRTTDNVDNAISDITGASDSVGEGVLFQQENAE